MKRIGKLLKYAICVLLVAVVLLPVLLIPTRAATASYQLGFVDENGDRIYGTITVDGVYIMPKTYTTTQYKPVVTFDAETGHYYDVTFQNDDGYYRFFTFHASSDDLYKDKSNTSAALTKVPYTVTVKYKDGTVAAGVQVKADNFNTPTTTDANGQCTVYGTYAQTTTVQVFDGVNWVTQTIQPTTPGRKEISFTLDTRRLLPVKVMLNGQDVTNITEVTAVGGDETIKSTNGSLQLKENVTYSISAAHCEKVSEYMGYPIMSQNGFSTGTTTYTVPKNPAAMTLNAALNKPVAEYYDFSQQQEPFLFTDGGVQTLALGKTKALDIQNRIVGATYSFESSNTSVLSVSGSAITAVSAGEATLKIKVEYLGSTAVSSTTVRVPKVQITRPFPTNIFAEYTYDGTVQTMDFAANNAYTITGNQRTNAGTHLVTIALKDKNNTEWAPTSYAGAGTDDITYNFIIKPAALSYTNPTAPNLTYNGVEQPLLKAISVENATVEYTLSQSGTTAPASGWSTSVPTGKDAGTYYVWYRMDADSNHIDVAPTAVKVEIKKATLTAEDFHYEPPAGAVFDGTEKAAAVSLKSGVDGTGEVRVQYVLLPNGTATTQAPVNAGSYKVVVSVEDGENYNAIQELTGQDWKFQIEQAAGTASVSVQDLIYGEEIVIASQSPTNGTNAVTHWFKAKDAADSAYTTTMPSDAGKYTVKAVFPETQNYKEAEVFDDFEILQRAVTVTADDAGKTYGQDDPAVLTWKITSGMQLATDPLSISISRDEGENAGTYAIHVGQTQGANANYAVSFVDGTFTIDRAKLTVAADNKSIHYGDSVPVYTVSYTGFAFVENEEVLDGTLVFDCDYEQYDPKGIYTICPKGYTSSNYDIAYHESYLEVKRKEIVVHIAPKTSGYGQDIVELTATTDGIVNEDQNVYELTTTASKTANVGKYDIEGNTLSDNYQIRFIGGQEAYEITKVTATVDTAPAAKELTYTGTSQQLITEGTTADGTMVYSLSENGPYSVLVPTGKVAGSYTVWYYVLGDVNHTDSAKTAVAVTIEKADPGIGTVAAGVVSDTLELSAVVLSSENETVPGTLTADANQTLIWGENEIAYTFTPEDTMNYHTVTGTTAVTVLDTVAPNGTVDISDNSWREFLNYITFGLFFKETQTVQVTAGDALSGVAQIDYYETKDVLDLAGVKALPDETWAEMKNGKVRVTAEDTKQFIYYIRIADNAGNVAYLATNGAEFDTTAPAISGVVNGMTYYTTQNVTVTDKNLDAVTLNGEAATGDIILAGNQTATYTIVATDKAGNSTVVTVKMAPIAAVSDAVKDTTEDNVTSDNKADLENIVNKVTELLKDEDVTPEEKAELEKVRTDAVKLINVIGKAQDARNTENTEKVKEVTAENVKPEEKKDLADAKSDLEKALEESGGNYTEEEKKTIAEDIQRMEAAIAALENVEKVEKTITGLPKLVEPDDEAAIQRIMAAKEAYDALTEHEKSLVDEAAEEKLEGLLVALTAYDIIQGNGGKWTQGSDQGLRFIANGPLSKFVGIEVDGKEVAAKDYEVKSGSTIITLKQAYLDTLATGEHTITVVYTDSKTEGVFYVEVVNVESDDPTESEESKPEASTPTTGDESNLMLYGSMLAVSLAGLVVLLLADKKCKRENA